MSFTSWLDTLWHDFLRRLARELERYLTPPRPGGLRFTFRKDPSDMTKYIPTVLLPVNPDPARVATQDLKISVDGGTVHDSRPPFGDKPSSFDLDPVADKAKIHGELQYFNATGDAGPITVEDFTVDSERLPPAPDQFGISIRAIDVPDEPPAGP
jgi:hypothetical protein